MSFGRKLTYIIATWELAQSKNTPLPVRRPALYLAGTQPTDSIISTSSRSPHLPRIWDCQRAHPESAALSLPRSLARQARASLACVAAQGNVMNHDKLDYLLSHEADIVPSSGFTASLMKMRCTRKLRRRHRSLFHGSALCRVWQRQFSRSRGSFLPALLCFPRSELPLLRYLSVTYQGVILMVAQFASRRISSST